MIRRLSIVTLLVAVGAMGLLLPATATETAGSCADVTISWSAAGTALPAAAKDQLRDFALNQACWPNVEVLSFAPGKASAKVRKALTPRATAVAQVLRKANAGLTIIKRTGTASGGICPKNAAGGCLIVRSAG
jgi:hypothetical protein